MQLQVSVFPQIIFMIKLMNSNWYFWIKGSGLSHNRYCTSIACCFTSIVFSTYKWNNLKPWFQIPACTLHCFHGYNYIFINSWCLKSKGYAISSNIHWTTYNSRMQNMCMNFKLNQVQSMYFTLGTCIILMYQ